MVGKSLMDVTLRFDDEGVDWLRAVDIFEQAELGTREPDTCRKAFANSDLVCFAWDGPTMVGMGRALSDFTRQSIIYDLCLVPEYQGRGLGKLMLQAMLDRLDTPTVVLWAVPGKQGFYKKFGFHPMLTAMGRFEDAEATAAKGYIKIDKL